MSFPVDILNICSHEDLESSGEHYMSELLRGNPSNPEFLSLPDQSKIPITLSNVGFVPLYGEEQTHKVLALFAPTDSFKAVALYLADRWWSIDDIVRTSVPARQGLIQVTSVGERIVLYVLNRIIYRTRELEGNKAPFLCHGSNEYAKIMWQKGEAIGFYSVKPTGSVCSPYRDQRYMLPVLDTMFVRKKYSGEDYELMVLEDFVHSFGEQLLGLRYPLSSVMYTACKQYYEKHPAHDNLFWEVEGPGHWFQKTSVKSIIEREELKIAEASQEGSTNSQAEVRFQQPAAVSEASGQNTELETQPSTDSQKVEESDVRASTSEDSNITPVSIWTRSSNLKRPVLGKTSQEPEPETSQRDKENVLHVSESRLELPAHTPESSEGSVQVPEKSTVEEDEEMTIENEGQSTSEVELHVSPPEKRSGKESPSEPLNGEVTEETGRTSLMAEEKTANEVLSGESKLQSEGQGEEPLTLYVPLILESPAKSSEDTVSEKVLNANDSGVLTEESTSVEKGTEEQQEPEKTTTENAAASALKDEPSDNGLPNSMVEAAEESLSAISFQAASSLEDQNEEAEHNSQESSVSLSQSSLIVVDLESVSFQQSSGQEGQKNQLEEHSEEPEQVEQSVQTGVERAADSSSEEAEIEVPVVDRRNLRRKTKGYKGPPKKKGKPA
ncbi:soluble lamin-associated protein of 75 kDa [Podargus strigoides]